MSQIRQKNRVVQYGRSAAVVRMPLVTAGTGPAASRVRRYVVLLACRATAGVAYLRSCDGAGHRFSGNKLQPWDPVVRPDMGSSPYHCDAIRAQANRSSRT